MKIVIGGHLNKEENKQIINNYDSSIEVDIMNDLLAAQKLKEGVYDYYFGSCQTGGGGALAMAIAINGSSKCITVASPGFMLELEKIEAAVEEGKIAFGFVPEAAKTVIPHILSSIEKRRK